MIENIKQGVLSKFPLLGSIMSNLVFESDDNVGTAATNGQIVKYAPTYLNNLTFEQQMFLVAHEVMHVAFDHILRSQGKDIDTWNIATDAVINQILVEANLPLPKGGVNIPQAKGKSAEEVYYLIYQKKNNPADKTGTPHSQHDAWQEAINAQTAETEAGQELPNNTRASEREKEFTTANEKLKKAMAQTIRQDLKKQSDDAKEVALTEGGNGVSIAQVGEDKAVISWKKILRRELEKDEDRWSYRRSDEDNDYQARIGNLTNDDKAVVEVMLDTSGSVSENLLRTFLRQVKHLFKDTKLLVGCFDTRFYGFQEIKKAKDIDFFDIVGRGGTDFDIALANFSHDHKINKIVFTDGFSDVSNTPENLKLKNLYWLVWANDVFRPCCGKVIFVDRYEMNYTTNKLTTCKLLKNNVSTKEETQQLQ